MTDIVQFSEEELVDWLKSQLEKREFMNGQRFEEKRLKEEINEILFYEQTMDWLRLIAVDEGITVSESTPLHANLNIAWGYCLSYKPPFDSRY